MLLPKTLLIFKPYKHVNHKQKKMITNKKVNSLFSLFLSVILLHDSLFAGFAAGTLVKTPRGYQLMKKYIQSFAYMFEFQELIELFHKLDIDISSDFFKSQIWKNWLLCVDATIQNKLTLNGSLVSIETIVSQNQAFEIMMFFLNIYCLTNINNTALAELLQKLQKPRDSNLTYQDWLVVYNQIQNKQSPGAGITVIQGFNAMRIFLEKRKHKSQHQHLESFLKLLQVDVEQIPVKYQTLWNWLHAAHIVVMQLIIV